MVFFKKNFSVGFLPPKFSTVLSIISCWKRSVISWVFKHKAMGFRQLVKQCWPDLDLRRALDPSPLALISAASLAQTLGSASPAVLTWPAQPAKPSTLRTPCGELGRDGGQGASGYFSRRGMGAVLKLRLPYKQTLIAYGRQSFKRIFSSCFYVRWNKHYLSIFKKWAAGARGTWWKLRSGPALGLPSLSPLVWPSLEGHWCSSAHLRSAEERGRHRLSHLPWAQTCHWKPPSPRGHSHDVGLRVWSFSPGACLLSLSLSWLLCSALPAHVWGDAKSD